MSTADTDASTRTLNLPYIIRHAFFSARERGRNKVLILIPEQEKDEWIKTLSNTRMCQEHQPKIDIFPIPGNFQVEGIRFYFEATEALEPGVCIIE